MTRRTRHFTAWVLLWASLQGLCCRSAGAGSGPPADLLLRRGTVRTMNPEEPHAETVAVLCGRIVFAGKDVEAERWIGPATRVIDLHGKTVLPGFHDAHVHPVTGGVELLECDLNGVETVDRLQEVIRTWAAQNPTSPWVRGGGWDLTLFPNAAPHRALLDALVPDRPVYLTSADAHSAWVNTRALELAGISKSTPDPPRGRIDREPESSTPTGTLREAAMALVADLLPPQTSEERLEGLRRAQRMAHAFGITSVQEANASEAVLETYAELERRGELALRVVLALSTHPEAGPAQVSKLADLRRRFTTPLLRPHAAKIFADGVIEAGTAALLEPYVGKPTDRGTLVHEPGALRELAAALDSAGFQIHVHAIGDRAVRTSLDALEHARRENGPRDARHHVAHVQLIHPTDLARFRELGVAANIQALWAYADKYITDLTLPVLGPDRSQWIYPFGSLARAGALLVAGSDWSVSSMNPLRAVEVAVTRRPPGDKVQAAFLPYEALDVETMLRAFTISGAWLDFAESDSGSIERGKRADLVVLEEDPVEVLPDRIHAIRVSMTIFDGRVVFDAASEAPPATRVPGSPNTRARLELYRCCELKTRIVGPSARGSTTRIRGS